MGGNYIAGFLKRYEGRNGGFCPSLAELEVWYYCLMRSANCTTSLVSRYPHDTLICMSTEYVQR